MSDVTHLLDRVQQGDPKATDELSQPRRALSWAEIEADCA
jgi:hypothetical protein